MTQDIIANKKIYSGIHDISDNFTAILLDAYGVFWGGNGVGVLPGCKEAMEKLVANKKIVGILSNSTQLAQIEIDKLKRHGLIEGKHFHFIITSGETAKNIFSQDQLPFPTKHKKFYCFSEDHPKFSSHQSLFESSSYQETFNLEDADFIYITIPHIEGKDQTNPLVFKERVHDFIKSKLPMVCANPDRYAHEGNPQQLVVRQGMIAKMYEKAGGTVFYIGKPSDKMFLEALKAFQLHKIIHVQDVLMVGDTPETDIRGASKLNIASALTTTTGIMAERIAEHGFEKTLKAFSLHDHPTFFIKGLA